MGRHFFRVDGADQETGEETYLVLQAENKPQAEQLAREQGLLIASVRVAKAEDWGRPSAAPALKSEFDGDGASEPRTGQAPREPTDGAAIAPGPLSSPVAASSAGSSPASRAAMPSILACVGGALIVGGILALALALWPDHVLRNELQQLEVRIDQLIQTVLAGTLVVSGMICFLLAGIFHLAPRG